MLFTCGNPTVAEQSWKHFGQQKFPFGGVERTKTSTAAAFASCPSSLSSASADLQKYSFLKSRHPWWPSTSISFSVIMMLITFQCHRQLMLERGVKSLVAEESTFLISYDWLSKIRFKVSATCQMRRLTNKKEEEWRWSVWALSLWRQGNRNWGRDVSSNWRTFALHHKLNTSLFFLCPFCTFTAIAKFTL